MSGKSKFTGLFTHKPEEVVEEPSVDEADPADADQLPSPAPAPAQAPAPRPQPKKSERVKTPEEPRGPGRPRGGKRSSAAHCQVTAYIRRTTHRAVQKRLLDDETRDFSDLVEELLDKWLKTRT